MFVPPSWRRLNSCCRTMGTCPSIRSTLTLRAKVIMSDKYANFAELARKEVAGVDYRILVRQATSSFAIVAPQGGGIEPGTSEIADAVAESDLSAGTISRFMH